MASKELQNAINGYENYILVNGIDEQVVDAYVMACGAAYKESREIGLEVSTRAKEIIEKFIYSFVGADSWELEKYAFANKTWYDILDRLYDVLLLEAQNMVVDSGFRYLEKKREPKERFYMPRRKQLVKIGLVDALQGMIDDKYDILCISMPPGTAKTTAEKFFNALIIGWFPRHFNLFYSHSGDITKMYYESLLEIVSNSDEYCWKDIFPDLSITKTDAKMEQFNVGKYKAFPSVQCTSVGSKNAGKVRANKFLLVDDMIGGIEEALNPIILDKLWNKYAVDARQRKMKGCKEIHIATRWSVNDVIGRIQQMYEGNPRVKIIAIPDVDENGKSNFDYEVEGFDEAFFADQQLLMDEISYKCLYKQEPIEREGLLYPEDKIQRYKELPKNRILRITGQCDTKGKGTDYFVLPCLVEYEGYEGTFFCVDAICNNSADYELQYENAANLIVDNEMQDCEFESNQGGDRVAMEVNKRVEEKGWICNITDVPTESNKEARIFQCSSWILQHVVFKDRSLYNAKDQYGVMMSMLLRYSVSGKNVNDDVPDVFSNFSLRFTRNKRKATAEAVANPFRGGARRGY